MRCVHEGCPRPVKVQARKLCNAHYLQLQRSGQLPALPREDRFWVQVDKTRFCWNWTGRREKGGYGKFGGRLAHRIAYERTVGPIPEGMTIDHSCRNPGCVNPGHLRLRTPSDNFSDTLFARRDRCSRGHTYDGANLRIRTRNGHQERICRACDRERQRAYKQRLKASAGDLG